MRLAKTLFAICTAILLAGVVLHTAVPSADGGRPLPTPPNSVFFADGGRPLPRPPAQLIADGGRPLPTPPTKRGLFDGGRPLPTPPLAGLVA
jgi:hypothetical protein